MGRQFEKLAEEALQRKKYAMEKDNGLSGNAPIPHDLWRRLVPIAREYEKGNGAMAQLYTYLLAYVNGRPDNDRYMSAFPSTDKIAEETGIGRNRIARLAKVLEAVGLLKTAYDYTLSRRNKLYFPQYYSDLSDEEIRRRLDKLYGQSP
ncbi:helix-turn-helix domain-containing protein [Bacillus haynesii]|uniref:helix-turn-helix domain-containing protein n=1 Tax=Bacillus haynesii TaxID=1925021 RepID=UPI002280E6AB|nr:helix-turn-helix domain-containing protein [Bacillus haynesii]MCY8099449.1 helix-turn-helix domain-containing protein [Bacillus haynesii]